MLINCGRKERYQDYIVNCLLFCDQCKKNSKDPWAMEMALSIKVPLYNYEDMSSDHWHPGKSWAWSHMSAIIALVHGHRWILRAYLPGSIVKLVGWFDWEWPQQANCFKAWFPVSGIVWEGLEVWSFEGGVSLGVGFVVLELHASPSLTLSDCKLKISCELSAAAPVPWQPAVILSTMIIMG